MKLTSDVSNVWVQEPPRICLIELPIYPHKPLRKIKCSSRITRLTLHFTCRLFVPSGFASVLCYIFLTQERALYFMPCSTHFDRIRYLNQTIVSVMVQKVLVNNLDYIRSAVFPQLDALHVLDASAHFDAGWSGRNTFWTHAEFNVRIDASAPFDAGHAAHNLLIDGQASNRGNTVFSTQVTIWSILHMIWSTNTFCTFIFETLVVVMSFCQPFQR